MKYVDSDYHLVEGRLLNALEGLKDQLGDKGSFGIKERKFWASYLATLLDKSVLRKS